MKQGYHAVYCADYFAGIKAAQKAGFQFAQFDLGVPRFFLNSLSGPELLDIKGFAQHSGVEITFHSPGDNVSLFSDYPLIRQGILNEFQMLLEKANVLGARHVTFHTGGYPQFKKAATATAPSAPYYENILYGNIRGC